MTRTTIMCIAASAWLGTVAGSVHATGNTCTQRGQEMLTALQDGHYDNAAKHFDATMHAKLTPAMLERVWTAMTQKFGPAHPADTASIARHGSYTVATIPLGYKGQNLAAEIACNASDDIAGFHIAPQVKP